MYLLGLTGGIASGKSTVSDMLAALDVPIVDADKIARRVVEAGRPVLREIVGCFGSAMLNIDGGLNRDRLAETIFNDAASKQKLDSIMHPAIKDEIFSEIEYWRRRQRDIVVLDVPLLFEIGWHKYTHSNWLVYVNETVQLNRLMMRNNLTQQQAQARINSQMKLADKKELADFVIDNNGSLEWTKKQVLTGWTDIIGQCSGGLPPVYD